MIAGRGVQLARPVRAEALLEMFQQQGLLVAGAYDEDRFAVLQRLVDPWKERGIVGALPEPMVLAL